jgi:hypothetical protein
MLLKGAPRPAAPRRARAARGIRGCARLPGAAGRRGRGSHRCTNTSPGSLPMISLAATRESTQPIHMICTTHMEPRLRPVAGRHPADARRHPASPQLLPLGRCAGRLRGAGAPQACAWSPACRRRRRPRTSSGRSSCGRRGGAASARCSSLPLSGARVPAGLIAAQRGRRPRGVRARGRNPCARGLGDCPWRVPGRLEGRVTGKCKRWS